MATLTRTWALRGALAIGAVLAGWFVVTTVAPLLPAAVQRVQALGPWAGVAFVALYALAVVCLLPASWLTLAAGAVFGLLWGVVYAFAGAVLGSALALLVARYVARPWVERWAGSSERFGAIDRAVAADGRKIVFLLRLTPLVPFTALNYLLGLTRISLADMLIASPAMLPGTLLYVYYGRVIGDLTALAAGEGPERGTAQYVLLGIGLLATLAVTIHVSRLARRALNDAGRVPSG